MASTALGVGHGEEVEREDGWGGGEVEKKSARVPGEPLASLGNPGIVFRTKDRHTSSRISSQKISPCGPTPGAVFREARPHPRLLPQRGAQAQSNRPHQTSQAGEQWPGFWAAGTSCAHSEAHLGPTVPLRPVSTPDSGIHMVLGP